MTKEVSHLELDGTHINPHTGNVQPAAEQPVTTDPDQAVEGSVAADLTDEQLDRYLEAVAPEEDWRGQCDSLNTIIAVMEDEAKDLRRAVRRMLRALDGYVWAQAHFVSEDFDLEAAWGVAFDQARARVESLIGETA